MPRVERRLAALLALLTAGTTAVVLATKGAGISDPPVPIPAASAWRGLVGSRPAVALGDRFIIVLRTDSLAQHVERERGRATGTEESAWTSAAQNAQRLLISRLGLQGISVHQDYSFSRVLDGFSTLLDPNALPLVESDPDVAGVYPVRVAYPADVSTSILSSPEFAPGSGHRPGVSVSGVDGRGVTIALLDTGVDASLPYLRGRIEPGIDIIGGDPGALAAVNPENQDVLERHGTEMAGLLVGSGGPSGLSGVAPGAAVLPIRVAGWQPDALGHWAIYGRSDQIIAGLDRAVDPNGDGNASDAVRIALLALAEPFAGFDDSPEAQAVAGATALNTLVVAPAGNDGASDSAYGDLAGPGGAPDALTVGALDTRTNLDETRIVIRSGLQTLLDRTVPVSGVVLPVQRISLELAAPRAGGTRATAPRLSDFFSRSGASLVAGRAAVVPMGASPGPAAERAVAAGASAVLLYGGRTNLPAGGLGLDESVPIPVVSISAKVAHSIVARLAAGAPSTVTLGDVDSVANAARDSVATFSSVGLAFSGAVKPELVAPGVAIATADPGTNADGSSRFVTVSGTSVAAAIVAGAAALVAQARPSLAASALKGVLVGSGKHVGSAPVSVQGAGLVAAGPAAAQELAASPSTLALGRSTGAGWSARSAFTLRSHSSNTIAVALAIDTQDQGASHVAFTVFPRRFSLRPGESQVVHVRARTAAAPVGVATADGVVVAEVAGGGRLRIPWAIPFASASVGLLGNSTLSATTFKPSDEAPTLLTVDAGRVLLVPGHMQIRPVRRLDIGLARPGGPSIGLLVRLRDLLPGRYTFGITGRGPSGKILSPGSYVLTLRAYPVATGPPTVRSIRFDLR